MLELAEEQTGYRDPALDVPACPDVLVPLLFEWRAISRRRTANGFGWNPIGWHELLAYQSQYGIRFTPWEVEMLTRIEELFLLAQAPLPDEDRDADEEEE